ncbi:hypothetical protein LPJ61_000883 [Coemansia biformis]|uniref:Vacuolar protein sorting-associated protein 8 central domain-containing protein n=1 Tax=Coemansia biformis TaxID=1286918 RepID=A0A9W7YB04_9FUNG|nr:hypothetical protein LPJ61_000883 [Coemansia biformis]
MDTDTVPSTPRSALEPTPESEYESRIANLDSAPSQRTTEYFSWHQLADMTGKLPSLAEQFGPLSAACMGDYVALGTEGGVVVVADYLGRAKAVLAPQAAAAYGSVSALAFSADHLALVAGYSQGFVAVWDWVKGVTVSASRPLQPDDRPGVVGHPLGTAVTAVGFVGASRHRYISASAGGHALYHHIVRRLLTTVSTAPLGSTDAETLFEAAALPQGGRSCATDDMGLVAVLTDASLGVWSTRHSVAQQYRASHQLSAGKHAARRTIPRRPYAGCVAWQPVREYTKATAVPDPAELDDTLPMLAYSWGSNIAVLAVRLEHNVAENGAPMGSAPPRVRLERKQTWTAVEDVVFCCWIEASVLLYMTRSQQLFVFEVALRQETAICASPPGAVSGRPWVTLATGAEAEALYAHAMCVYKRRVFAVCGASSVYTGRLLSWAERLQLLVEQDRHIDAITLATGFYQGRTGRIVAGLPRPPHPGDAGRTRRQVLVGGRLEELMHSALERTLAAAQGPGRAGDPEVHALASICVEACLALGNLGLLFGDIFEHFATEPVRRHIFLATIEPFILSGEIARLPPQILNAMIDSYATAPALVSRLGETLMHLNLRPGEFDIDRVLGICRQHRLWRTFARVWLAMGDPTAPVMSIVAAARSADGDGDGQGLGSAEDAGLGDEAPGVVVFEYLDMVLRGRSYPDGQLIAPQGRAEKYSALVAELVFPPVEAGPALDCVPLAFDPLLALLGLGTERFLATLRRVLGDPFIGFINLIIRPASRTTPKNSDRTLRRASQVKSFLQIVVDTFYVLATAAYADPEHSALSRRQVGLLSSFALSLYATRFPLIYLKDETLAEWSSMLLRLGDASTRAEREHAFELLFRLNPPRAYDEYIERVRDAGFFRVLEQIYSALERHDDALQTLLDHPDFAQHRAVFPAMRELAASGRPKALACIASFVQSSAARLAELDADAFAAAVGSISSLDHDVVVGLLRDAPPLQFAYLRALLDPAPDALARSPEARVADERAPPNIGLSDEQHIVVYPFKSLVPGSAEQSSGFPQRYHERYLELMCQLSPGGVVQYLRRHADLSPEPFRLAHVQAVCRQFGVSDGIVWALVRLGDFSGALQTLLLQADQAAERVAATLPDADGGAGAQEPPALSEACRERLIEHLDAADRSIDGCIDVCKSALARLGRTGTSAGDAAAQAQSDYRQLAGAQLCDLWLALLRHTLGHLHETGRMLDGLGPAAAAATREAWQLVSKRQRWMLQSVLDALISAASPATSFISLRHIVQQLIAAGSATGGGGGGDGQPGAARSLGYAEVQHLLAVAVSAYKTEAQLVALTNVLVDYDLFTTFAQLVRSQKQGWHVPADGRADGRVLARHDASSVGCSKCRRPLFADMRQARAMAGLRTRTAQYYESSALRVLDLHVFEDPSAQWQWMKLRAAAATHDAYLDMGGAGGGGGAPGAQQQAVLFKCGHGFHRQCLSTAAAAGKDAAAGRDLAAAHGLAVPECLQCAGRAAGGHRRDRAAA